jgi:hypothetical protein
MREAAGTLAVRLALYGHACRTEGGSGLQKDEGYTQALVYDEIIQTLIDLISA